MEIRRHQMLTTMVRRSLLNNARISVWTLLTFATCAALVTLFTTVRFEVGRKLGHELRTLGANAVAYPGNSDAVWAKLDEVARRLGARMVSLSLEVRLIDGKPVGVVAADPHRLGESTPYWLVTGGRAHAGGECMAGRRVAATFDWKLGQEVDLGGDRRRLVGIVETGDEDEERIFIPATGAARDGFHYALISVAGGEAQIQRLQDSLAGAGAGIEIRPLRQVLYGEQQVLEKVNVLFATTLGVVLILTAMGVSASMLARVVERRKEFALLRAIGAQERAVAAFLLAESAVVGVAGAGAGLAAGTWLAALAIGRVFHVAVGPYWGTFVAALATTTLVALTAAAIACGRVMRSQPAEALRGE